jgi:hypothetical protein
MKIDFELLDDLVKAGANGEVIVTLLRKQHDRGEAKRKRDRSAVATKRSAPEATSSDKAPVVVPKKNKKAAVRRPVLQSELPVGFEQTRPGVLVKAKKSRIEEGWKLDARNLDYGMRIGLSELECAKEWVKFCGHHGAKGSEFVDWNKAWENWARRSMEFSGKTPRDPNKPLDDHKPSVVAFSLEQWKRVLTIYGSTSNWHESWGPPPGENGCRVPAELLADQQPEFEMQEGKGG